MCEGLHTDTIVVTRIHINNYFYAFYFDYGEMSHTSTSKPLFIFGVTILSLILITAITSLPLYQIVFAAEDDDKDKQEEEEEKEEEESSSKEEDEGSKEEEKEEEEGEEKSEESNEEEQEQEPKQEDDKSSNETTAETLPNITTTPQIIPDQPPIANLTPVPQQPTIPTLGTAAEEVISTTTTEAEPIIEKEFNATCKCMTIPSSSSSTQEKPTKPKPNTSAANEQIPLTKEDIQDSKSFGEVVDPAYTSFYAVPNLLDTIINDVSFWSQAGKSSFYIKLDNALDNYQVCSMEVNVYQPKSTPFLLDVGVSQNYSGILDQPNERINFEKCVKNMDEILMIFDNPSNSFVSIGEIKLFGSKLGTSTAVPPTSTPQSKSDHPLLQQSPLTTTTAENATKINIQDSTAEIDIKNSTVTFKFDPSSAQATNYNVITLPNTEVVK